MAYTFRGGVHVDEHKNTENSPIEKMTPPAEVAIPMSQHIGAPAVPLVAVGDRVLRGQMIGEVAAGLGCPIHSSVSGTVRRIEERRTATGQAIKTVVIENDGKYELAPSVVPYEGRISDLSPEQITEKIRLAGISGMGGATFPTYAKIRSAAGKVDRMFINCAECEPYITANHRLLLEDPSAVINGAKILLRALGLDTAEFAIEDNKMNAVRAIEGLTAGSDLIRVRVMKTKYPQGDERQLIYALTGKELPMGKLPADAGCIIFNAETTAAVYRAVALGMPLVERVVTVDGDCVKQPKNVLAPIGTSFRDLVEFCGGLVKTPSRLISGGPMMGIAQWDINSPVTKGTSAILLLSDPRGETAEYACIHCGRCVAGCPMHLMPNYISTFAAQGDFDMAEKYGGGSCVECGCCSYNCPGRVPIVQFMRVAKAEIIARTKARAAAAKK